MNRISYSNFRRLRPYRNAFALSALSLLSATSAHAQRGGRTDGFAPPSATLHHARSREFHVKNMRVELAFDVVNRAAKGRVTHTLTPFRSGLSSLTFDAGKNLNIAACSVNGADAKFTHEGDQLVIAAPALPGGRDAIIAIQYAFSGAANGGGANGAGGIHWISPGAAPERRPAAGRLAPPRNREALPPDPNDRRLAFWTQGETEGNRLWVPLYDAPNDKTTSETIITVPETWTVIGNGIEGKTTQDKTAKTRTYRWTMKQPHSTYLLSLVAGELDVKRSSWQGVPLYYAVPKGRGGLIDGSFGDTPDMLTTFSNALGVKYPWPKYAQSAMWDFPGGMENVSATTLGANALTDARSGDHAMASLNSHELAHQWFGDYVTCKEWGDVWLNESFATFMEAFYLEHARGEEAYQRDMEGNLQSYLNEAKSYKRPLSTKLYSNPDVMFDRHTYPKGGFILHMLRHQLGDADFFKGLGYYLKTNAYTPVDAHDLSKAFEVATGKNVDDFFDQWIYKPGHPELETAWKYDDAAKVVVLTVKQMQDTSDGTPIYHFPLTIGFLPSGSAGGVERKVIQITQAAEDFRIPVSAPPAAALIDPDHELLKDWKTAPQSSENLALLKAAPSAVDRGKALSALTGGGVEAPESLQKTLVALLPTETSSEVASLTLKLLANAKNPAYRGLFQEQAKSKQYGRKAAALRGLGLLPNLDKDDIALLRSVGLSDTEKYEPVREALRALAAQDIKGNLDVFRHQMASHSLRDQLAATSVFALVESKSPDAAGLLLETAGNASVRSPLRVEAISYFKNNPTLGGSDGLLPLLNSDAPDAQIAAIEALTARKDKAAVPALQTLATTAKNAKVVTAAKDAVATLNGN